MSSSFSDCYVRLKSTARGEKTHNKWQISRSDPYCLLVSHQRTIFSTHGPPLLFEDQFQRKSVQPYILYAVGVELAWFSGSARRPPRITSLWPARTLFIIKARVNTNIFSFVQYYHRIVVLCAQEGKRCNRFASANWGVGTIDPKSSGKLVLKSKFRLCAVLNSKFSLPQFRFAM